MRAWFRLICAFAIAAASPAFGQAEMRFDPSLWLSDLEQMRSAFREKYANWEWLAEEREVDLERMFALGAQRLGRVGSDAEARALFDRFVRQVGDGHVTLTWPTPPRPAAQAPAGAAAAAFDLCASLGYDARQSSAGLAPALTGYSALAGEGNVFAAGTITVDGRKVGVVRIGVFQPHGSPALCRAAAQALSIPEDKPCDERCADAILTWAYKRLTSDFEDRLRQIEAAGAQALLVDITGNGGGSEWAEAAARSVSGRPLVSARRGFVRGPHWARQWGGLAQKLQAWAKDAPDAERRQLLAWAAEAEAARKEAERPCTDGCPRIARAGFATGLVGTAPAGAFKGKPWAPHIFSIAQHDYHDGVWSGPLLVLVDQETWSAAEEFAAILQDNEAAVVIGARTGGAGCGHTWGGTPTRLSNSGAVLQLPDCVRYRKDGSNEVRGIIPDHLVGFRANDGARLKARLVEAKLGAAVA
jgi:hypothetical protein